MLLAFSSEGLEIEMCVCCCLLEAAQSVLGVGETDLKLEQDRGSRVLASVPPFPGGGEVAGSQ